jgi:hypothetical protein
VLGRSEFGAERKGATGQPWRHLEPRVRDRVGPWVCPGMDGAWSGSSCDTRLSGAGGSPGAVVLGRAWESQGKGERELASGLAHGVGTAYQRDKERERGSLLIGGSGRRAVPVSNGLKNNPNLIETRPNLIRSKKDIPLLQNF